MAEKPGPVEINRFRRPPQWLRTSLVLESDEVPGGLFLPGVVPTVDITAVATRVVFAPTVALVAGTVTQLPDIEAIAIGLQAPAANGAANVLLGGPGGVAGVWELGASSSLFLSLSNANMVFATMSAGAGNLSIIALQAV